MRRGLTLVEVLVIVVILGVAVALLLPATECAREAARRINCLNSQKQLALAMHSFESRQKQFPGFRQSLAGQDVSWTVLLLPDLERTDLWKKWERGISEKDRMTLMICPTEPRESMTAKDNFSSYAVNTKVCMDGRGLSLNYIASKDGTKTTLLVSENLRADKAHNWWDTDPTTVGFTDGPMKDNVGSSHPTVVQAAFCDGHGQALRKDIADALFKALVTPNGGEHVAEDELD